MKFRNLAFIYYCQKGLALFLCAYFASAYLSRSLGTKNPVTFVRELPGVLSSRSMDSNPFAQTPYWNVRYVDGNHATLPYPHYWCVDEMLNIVADKVKTAAPSTITKLTILTDYEWMCGDYFRYKVLQHKLQDHVCIVQRPSPKGFAASQLLPNYDFLIMKTGKIYKNNFYGLPWADESQALVDNLLSNDGSILKENGFIKLKSFSLPDGSEGMVWMSRNYQQSSSMSPIAERP